MSHAVVHSYNTHFHESKGCIAMELLSHVVLISKHAFTCGIGDLAYLKLSLPQPASQLFLQEEMVLSSRQ